MDASHAVDTTCRGIDERTSGRYHGAARRFEGICDTARQQDKNVSMMMRDDECTRRSKGVRDGTAIPASRLEKANLD